MADRAQVPQYVGGGMAFPSGHLSTLVSTVTILEDNYLEKRYIKLVGYIRTGLAGFAMINIKVRWVTDYPLAVALGYLSAREVEKLNRKELSGTVSSRGLRKLSITLNFFQGRPMPGIVNSL